MIHQVGEESIENLKSCVNLQVILAVNESEQQVEEVLPDESLLLIDGATDFDQEVADLVDGDLVSGLADDLEELVLDVVLAVGRETLPEVGVVVLVADVLGVSGGLRDVSTEDNGSEGLHIRGVRGYRKEEL